MTNSLRWDGDVPRGQRGAWHHKGYLYQEGVVMLMPVINNTHPDANLHIAGW